MRLLRPQSGLLHCIAHPFKFRLWRCRRPLSQLLELKNIKFRALGIEIEKSGLFLTDSEHRTCDRVNGAFPRATGLPVKLLAEHLSQGPDESGLHRLVVMRFRAIG